MTKVNSRQPTICVLVDAELRGDFHIQREGLDEVIEPVRYVPLCVQRDPGSDKTPWHGSRGSGFRARDLEHIGQTDRIILRIYQRLLIISALPATHLQTWTT